MARPKSLSTLPTPKNLTGLKARKAKKAYLNAWAEVERCNVTKALAAAGITLDQLKAWRKSDAVFSSLEEEAKLFKDDNLREKIDELIDEKNVAIIGKAMNRLEEYAPVRKTEISVKGKVLHQYLMEAPEEELDGIIQEGAKLVELERGRDYEVDGD